MLRSSRRILKSASYTGDKNNAKLGNIQLSKQSIGFLCMTFWQIEKLKKQSPVSLTWEGFPQYIYRTV